MAIKDEMAAEPKQEQLTDTEEKDLSIAVMLAQNLIDDAGAEVIESSKGSKDQGEVIGQFIFQMGSQLGEQLQGMIDLSPRIFLIEGGWVEQVSDYLQEEYKVPRAIMDRAELYIGGMAQKMAEGQQGEAAGLPPEGQPEQPPMPEQMPPTMPQAGGAM